MLPSAVDSLKAGKAGDKMWSKRWLIVAVGQA
jgi:hypothetical protein